jgi:putative long chain acyl-CoA synthase
VQVVADSVDQRVAHLVGYARRVAQTARNVAEVVRFGGLETDDEQSPYDVAAARPNYRLRHYFPAGGASAGMPVLLVPPLMLTAEIWDVSPSTSAVAALHSAGADPWVVDFGHPDREPGGLERTLTDHVLAVSDAIEQIGERTGRDAVLAGYSQGGMFAYQVAAYRRGKGIDSLVTFGSPVDTTAPLPIPVAPDVVARVAGELVESGLLRRIAVPGWVARTGFKLLSPAKSVQARVQFLLALHNRDALLPRERQRRFLDETGWTAYSGPAIAELLEQFVTHNRMLDGGFVIDDRLVTLADIDVPILTFVGTTDTIGHPDSVRAIRRAAPRAAVYEVSMPTGHFGLVVGSTASGRTWPAVAEWIAWRDHRAPLPTSIQPAEAVPPGRPLRPSAAATAAAQTVELGVAVGRALVTTARRATSLAGSVAREAPAQLPKLARIEHLDPTTRVSLGLLLDEQARRAPRDVVFLFGDRAYRHEDVKRRIDNVVKGLIEVGVRHGDRVGVIMQTRPSAFTLVAALSRLGATAVLLRPDGDLRRETRLAEVTRIVSDPEHVGRAAELDGVRWAVLGGGGEWRDLHAEATDMERIDPDRVELPAWYEPNPHRAADVAFVLFTGDGTATKALQITNRRWALSALGTASAAALKAGDTVYSVTPIHHSSALLMSVGGAVAGGARFAMAGGDDVATFWAEVRRYGATHVAYTWTSLREVVDAPRQPSEQHHPIRMFLGSGMPRNLWRRVAERFPTTRVLEFYASAEGEAILANVTGRAPGSMGRPLPGTPEVRVAGCDLRTGALEVGADGLARECGVDEVGLLLARVDPWTPGADPGLRSVFAPGDGWRSTGDLFLRDDQGDLWLAGSLSEVVRTAQGPALPSGTRFALGALPGADLVVAYGVPAGEAATDATDNGAPGDELLVGAFTVRADTTVTTAELEAALGKLPTGQRPDYVQQVATIPLTTWHRPQWRTLQAKGVPEPGRGRVVWRLGPDRSHYEQLA